MRSLFQVLDEELLPRLDVEAAYPDVAFKIRRGRYWRGGCPLHGGADPNFSVDTQTLSWSCFSYCGHGSYLAYLNGGESPRGTRFVELVRALAEQVGVEIDDREASPEQAAAARRRALLEGFVARAGEALHEPAGRRVVEYLGGRGLPTEPAELVRLGLGAHPGAAGMAQLRAASGDLHAAGLSDPRWTGRLLIPWRDDYGRIETIAARSVDDSEPRYLYLADAPLPPFYRSGRRTARDAGAPLVIVEGFLDAILLRWAGVANVVATGGTALGQRHVEVLAAGSERTLVLAFDVDEAGRLATRRLVALLRGAALDRHIRAVPIEAFGGAKDPAELVAREGAAVAGALVRAAVPWLVAEAMDIVREVAPDSPVARRRDALDALERLAASAWGADRDADLEDLARLAVEVTGYSDGVVLRALGLTVRIDPGPGEPADADDGPHRLSDATLGLLRAVFGGRLPQGVADTTDGTVWQQVDTLGPVPRSVLRLHFGAGTEARSLDEIGAVIAESQGEVVPPKAVQRILETALAVLRAEPVRSRLLTVVGGAVHDPVANEVVRILANIGVPVRIMTLVHLLRRAEHPKARQLIEEHRLTGLPSKVISSSMTHSAYRGRVLAVCNTDDRITSVGPASLGLASWSLSVPPGSQEGAGGRAVVCGGGEPVAGRMDATSHAVGDRAPPWTLGSGDLVAPLCPWPRRVEAIGTGRRTCQPAGHGRSAGPRPWRGCGRSHAWPDSALTVHSPLGSGGSLHSNQGWVVHGCLRGPDQSLPAPRRPCPWAHR